MSWTIGSEQILEINELHFRTVTIDQPRKTVSTATWAVVTSPLKENDIGSTSGSEADTLNSLFGFFDRFGDLPFFPTPIMAHGLLWKVIIFSFCSLADRSISFS
jgi:hypothetical protein